MRKLGAWIAGAGIIFALAVLVATSRGGYSGPARSAPATISVNATAAIVNVHRIGMNLGSWTYYGAEQFSSNVLMNPGFEPTIDRAIVIVHDINAEGFSDDSQWLGRPDDFWKGASFQVRTGRSAGTSGSIASSLKSASDGLPWFSTTNSPPPLRPGDVISLTITQVHGVPANWWVPKSSIGCVAINVNDHRPGSPGYSVAQLTLRTGQPTAIASYLDSAAGTDGAPKFLPVDGPWQLSFWSRATSGTPTMSISLQRLGAISSTSLMSRTVPVPGQWRRTVINFTAADTGPPGTLALNFSASGQRRI